MLCVLSRVQLPPSEDDFACREPNKPGPKSQLSLLSVDIRVARCADGLWGLVNDLKGYSIERLSLSAHSARSCCKRDR